MPKSPYSRNRNRFNLGITSVFSFLVLCLILVGYEYIKLDVFTVLDKYNHLLEKHKKNENQYIFAVTIANYQDSKRCGEALHSLFTNISNPDLVVAAVHDQLFPGTLSCLEVYCTISPNCRSNQVRSSVINAKDSKGPTVARYMAEELIEDEEFCVNIDSHTVFVENWDTKALSQWYSLNNEYAILSAYPKDVPEMSSTDTEMIHMCYSHIESDGNDSMIEYGPSIGREPGPLPRLCSQLAGGFSFGNCRQALDVRNDPYTPYLFHGEEYSRAARLWTHGYDIYCPNEDIVYHWYETRLYIWDKDWDKRSEIQERSQRRIRHMLGLPISRNDVDLTHIDKFSLGNKRTFEQWKEFSSIEPAAPYNCFSDDCKQFNACRELEYVPWNI